MSTKEQDYTRLRGKGDLQGTAKKIQIWSYY